MGIQTSQVDGSPAQDPGAVARPHQSARPAVLVVDRSEVIRASLCAWLQSAFPDYRCIEASGVVDARSKAAAERPAVVLVNVEMPDAEGLRVLRALSAEQDAAPLVAVSTQGPDSFRPYATGAGASVCVSLGAPGSPGLKRLLGSLPTGATRLPGGAGAPTLRRVLVVDDNPLSAGLVWMLMEPAGFEVATAADAKTALAAIAEFKPQLIVLDLELPDMYGASLARQVRADPASRDIRIIVLTAHTPEVVEADVRAAGCDGLLTKPVEPATFVASVRRCLERADAR